MSKPAPRKLPLSFWILWIGSFLLIWQFMGKPATPAVPLKIDEVVKTLKQQNVELKDVSIASTYQQYSSLLDDEVKASKIPAADAETKKREGAILVANTQLRAGVMREDPSRLRLAYQTLWNYQKQAKDTPVWLSAPVLAAADSRFPQIPNNISGQELFDTTSKLLSEGSQREKVWGMIPGGYQFIDFLVMVTGRLPGFSYWFATFLLALIVRAVVYPFSQRTIMHSRKMAQLTPLMTEIKEEFKSDAALQQRKLMELYQTYGLNPVAGCAPALIQMPLFLTVYQFMLMYQFEFQKGSFLWINEGLSKVSQGFIGPNLGSQDTILILLYGISMLVSQWLTPVSDPAQVKQVRLMGIGITVLFTFFMFTGAFPVVSGFVLYWTFTNILATAQSLRAYRLPLPPLQKVNTSVGGVVPGEAGAMFPWMRGLMQTAEAKANELKDADPNHSTASNSKSASSSKDSGTKATGVKTIAPKPGTTGKPKQHKPRKK